MNIAELVVKYLNREELTPPESEALKLWLAESDNFQKLEAQFRDPDWLADNLKVVGQIDEIDHWRKFMERLEERGHSLAQVPEVPGTVEEAPVRRIAVWKYAVAAMVILTLSAGGYWMANRPKAIPEKPVTAAESKDLAPGGNKAVLELANGSKIVLDNSGNGQLAEQGTTKVIKMGDGRVSYTPTTPAQANGKPSTIASVLYNTISTPAGGQYQVVLPDGTKAWINASSSLRFPLSFSNNRKVAVSGEAYFEVAKDAGKPFIVESGNRSVTVLGTSFNVNAYNDEPVFAVSLVEGAVRVEQGTSQETLKPGQQAQVSNGGIRVADHVNLRQVTAWKDGLFKFVNADIQTVMREIARWYDVEIVYEGKIPEDRFTGTMDKNLNASDVLKILALSKVHFRIEGKKIIVMP